MKAPTVGRRARRARHVPVRCAASGWLLGAGSLTGPGQVTCPRCDQPVAARAARAGVVEVEAHLPVDAVTCGACGTTHARWRCPTCRQRVDAADEVLHGFVFARHAVAVPGEAR